MALDLELGEGLGEGGLDGGGFFEAAVKRAQDAMANKHELGSEESAAVQAALAKSLAQLRVKRHRRNL